jgi:hypothetical protein
MQTAIDSATPSAPPTPASDPSTNQAAAIADEEQKQLIDFQTAKIYLQSLVTRWKDEEQRTEANRLTRDIEFNIDALRETGDIDDDECFIPERIIDSNIQREMPSYINYLKNSRRIATFTDIVDDTFDADRLEQQFTKVMTYKGWTKPHFKVVDGSATHAWACVEVMYDTRYPGNCCVEYIAHEDLIFPMDAKDLQACTCIIRRYKLSPLQLKAFVTSFGFSQEQVNYVLEKRRSSKQDNDKTCLVYKRMSKYQGAVYASWFTIEEGATDWLKSPVKLYAGIDEQKTVIVQQPQQIPHYDAMGQQVGVTTQMVEVPQQQWVPVDLENYPIFLLPYRETEKPLIFDLVGRVFLDKDKQEAQTAILTAFVNRMNRSQKVFASPDIDVMNDGRPAKQLANVKLIDGTIWDKPMKFWSMEPPDPIVLKALEYMDTANSQDIGQTDFAALNREDSRKTAREITAAQQAQSLLDSVDLTLYSEFIREVYSFAWLVVRSQALQNKIKFLQIPNPAAAQQMQRPQSAVDSSGPVQNEQAYINDTDTLSRTFDVRAAGDVDVIQKAELVQQMSVDWQVIQQTPLATTFLCDLMKLKYPQDGAIYSQILQEGNPKNQVIQALGSLVQDLIKMPGVAEHIKADPSLQQGLTQIEAEAQQALKAP